jgi:hypothetical protein
MLLQKLFFSYTCVFLVNYFFIGNMVFELKVKTIKIIFCENFNNLK